MKLEFMNTVKQFEGIKKNDLILVKWSDDWVRHMPKAKNVMFYNVYENKSEQGEIICQRKDNHYFNYDMYLEKSSGALEVYKVIDNNSKNIEGE